MTMILDGSTGLTTPTYNGTVTAEYSVPVTAFKNRIINGAMVIDQRNAGASVSNPAATETYVLDRWSIYGASASKFTAQQSTTVPSNYKNSFLLTSSAATTPGAADTYGFRQKIEGLNVSDLGFGSATAQTITLSFLVRSSITGTYAVSILNSALNRSYVGTYTISSANTWEQKSITITGDTSGTWLTTNGTGLDIWWDLGSGSNFNATAGVWNGSTKTRTSSSANWIGTSGATLYITGVQLEKGSTATSFDYRPYSSELAMCQRYCFKMATTSNYGPYGMGHGTGGTTNFRTLIKTAQTMRAQPSLSFSAANTFQWGFGNVLTAISAAEYGTDAFSVGCDTTGVSSNGAYMLTSANNTTSYILATAEL